MKWWRVEFDETGRVVSIRECDPSNEGSGTVVYVEAVDDTSARKAAKRKHLRIVERRLRERYRAQGLCACGQSPLAGRKICQRCIDKTRNYEARVAAGQVGHVGGRSIEEPRRVSTRREVLREVLKAWEFASNNRAFSDWLRAEIAKVGEAR